MVILKNEEWINGITPDMLETPYNKYAEAMGVKGFLNFCKDFGGITIYVPKAENAFKNIIFDKIREEFNGYNHQRLALKYHLSERTIRNIIAEDKILKGQLTIFDYE